MATSIDPLRTRAILGRKTWAVATPFGPDGWKIDRLDSTARLIVTVAADEETGIEWLHASISHPDHTPTYDELALMHRAVFGSGWAFQVFSPASAHINIHPFALHLWGRLDGARVHPDFGSHGFI